MENLVIFGGSFDPIHNGHLAIATSASFTLHADVVFVPAKSPRWKTNLASAKDRLNMVKLAIKSTNLTRFYIDEFELNSNAEINYSIDTVKYMASKYPDRKLFMLIGADEVNLFPEWKDSKEIIKYVTIIYAGRPNHPINDEIIKEYGMKRLPIKESFIAASKDIRELKCLDIPESVRSYISDNQLYYIEKIKPYLTERRLQHSIAVANLALLIAKKNNIPNYQKAYIAGLLHDVGKYVRDEEAKEIMIKHYPEYIGLSRAIWHQFLSVYIVERDFDIHDSEILEAIKYHTTGRVYLPPIAKIVYCSDKIEPTRGFDSRKLINSCVKNFFVGFLDVMESNYQYYKDHKIELDEELSKPFFKLHYKEFK